MEKDLMNMTDAERTDWWTKLVASKLVGRKITKVEYMDTQEAKKYGWYQRPVILFLDNGSYLVPLQDDEGNDGGSLSFADEALPIIPVMR